MRWSTPFFPAQVGAGDSSSLKFVFSARPGRKKGGPTEVKPPRAAGFPNSGAMRWGDRGEEGSPTAPAPLDSQQRRQTVRASALT
jgi:hypothetical protein